MNYMDEIIKKWRVEMPKRYLTKKILNSQLRKLIHRYRMGKRNTINDDLKYVIDRHQSWLDNNEVYTESGRGILKELICDLKIIEKECRK